MGHPADHGRRPTGPEIADILRDHAHSLRLSQEQLRVVSAIVSCRTGWLGGHIEICKICGFKRNAYKDKRRTLPTIQQLLGRLAMLNLDQVIPTVTEVDCESLVVGAA